MKERNKLYLLLIIIFLLCLIGKITAQSLDQVRKYIDSTELKYKEIVIRQSVLETGWYKSYSCKHRNNLFGFRYKGKYLEFSSWQESVQYYIRWQKRHYKTGDYYDFLKQIGYATDPEYITKLKRVKI